MTGQSGEKVKKDVKVSSVKDVQKNSVFGRYSEAEMVAQLKRLAMDPCKPEFARDNIQPLCNQILRIKKVMQFKDSEIPWRKRKLEQYIKDKFRLPSGVHVPDQQNTRKLSRKQPSHASSASCLLNSSDTITEGHNEKLLFDSRSSSSLLTFDDMLPEKLTPTELSSMVPEKRDNKDTFPTVDSGESVYGSNPPSRGNPNSSEAPSPEVNITSHTLNSPAPHGSNKKHLQPPRRSNRLQNLIGDHLQKCIVPVGPRFQADVPEWSDPVNKSILLDEYKNNSDNSKWLGTRSWPVENVKRRSAGKKTIGQGRSSACNCASPGSVECIKRHILQERQFLQCDLGPVFFTWKFDEMGEQISKSWTLKEQKTFNSVMKSRPSSTGKNFVKLALKSLVNKSRKDIVSYYFNVYIPARMSLETRSSPVKLVDTDDEDEAEDSSYMRSRKR